MRRSDTVLEGAQPIGGDGSGEVLDTEDAVQTVLDAFEDADCRAILDRTSDESLTASEVATACDLPLSTTYRKLELLTMRGYSKRRRRSVTMGNMQPSIGESSKTLSFLSIPKARLLSGRLERSSRQ